MPEVGAQPVDIITAIRSQITDIQTKVGNSGKIQWYVDASVSASGAGTSWATAFKTPQEAINAASANDIILIQSGFYDNNLTATGLTIDKTLKLIGVGVASVFTNTHASASSHAVVSSTTDMGAIFCEFDNIAFNSPGIIGVTFGNNSAAPRFTNCWFQQLNPAVKSTGDTQNGVVLFRNCIFALCYSCFYSDSSSGIGLNFFDECMMTGLLPGAGTAINLVSGALNLINKCTIVNFAVGVHSSAGTGYNVISGGYFNNTQNFDLLATGDVIIGANEASSILSGNSIQDDLQHIYVQLAASQKVYPTLHAGVNVVSSTSAWTLGSGTEIVPVNTITSNFHITGVSLDHISDTAQQYELVLYDATASTEISRIAFDGSGTQTTYNLNCNTIDIPANHQISAALASSEAAANNVNVKITYHTHA